MPKPGLVEGSSRLTDHVSLGVLAEILPRELIEEVLEETDRRERRSRRLPGHVMVRFCLAMCLFYDDDYEEVMRKLAGSLREMGSWRGGWVGASELRDTPGRRRVGAGPVHVF